MDASEPLALHEGLFVQDELPTLLALIARDAASLCSAERGFVVLLRVDGLDLDGALASAHGGMTREDVAHDAPHALRALGRAQAWGETDAASGRSILCAPFASVEDQRGAIVLERSRGRTPFDERSVRRAGQLASQVGIAVRVTQRLEELRARCERLASASTDPDAPRPVRKLEDLEREAILHALEATGNDKRRTADLLGISRAKVYQRLKSWGLS
ncbi:MAG: hypothetical protein FJ298_07785 [Planctomycetes bacterium]|nr:hypothetical protein [Planctomycetota bacterium]